MRKTIADLDRKLSRNGNEGQFALHALSNDMRLYEGTAGDFGPFPPSKEITRVASAEELAALWNGLVDRSAPIRSAIREMTESFRQSSPQWQVAELLQDLHPVQPAQNGVSSTDQDYLKSRSFLQRQVLGLYILYNEYKTLKSPTKPTYLKSSYDPAKATRISVLRIQLVKECGDQAFSAAIGLDLGNEAN